MASSNQGMQGLSQQQWGYLLLSLCLMRERDEPFEAFPLKSHLMKPYPGRQMTNENRIFNYRLSRARRTSENAFGILASRFQVFRSPIRASPTTTKDIALAAVTLHNYLRVCSKESDVPPDMLDREDIQNVKLLPGQWRQHPHNALERLPQVGRGHAQQAKEVRDKFREYFNNEGRVHWQERMCFRH